MMSLDIEPTVMNDGVRNFASNVKFRKTQSGNV